MARGKNQVTLTFAGDHDQLTKSFEEVGSSAREMSGEVGSASGEMASTGQSFDTLGDGVGNAEQKMRGFRDIIDGTGDVTRGFATGDISLMTKGFADIAAGSADLVIPALKRMGTWLANTRVGILAKAAAEKVAAAASATWAGIQRVLNFVLAANPIGIVVVAIAALVAAIILAWKNSETFRKIVKAAWAGVQAAVEAVVNWFTGTAWPAIQAVWDGIVAGAKFVWRGIEKYFGFWKGIVDTVIGWVSDIPRRLRSGLANLFNIITAPFRSAFNFVSRAWNNTIGSLSWSVPSWVPGIGGNTFAAPRLPTFHQGGMVSGAMGREVLAVLRAGERVTPAGGSQHMTVQVTASGGGTRADRALAEVFAELVRTGAIALTVRDGRVVVG